MTDSRLDPQIRAFLEEMEAEGGAPLETLPIAEGRQAAAAALVQWRGDPEELSLEGRGLACAGVPVEVFGSEYTL